MDYFFEYTSVIVPLNVAFVFTAQSGGDALIEGISKQHSFSLGGKGFSNIRYKPVGVKNILHGKFEL